MGRQLHESLLMAAPLAVAAAVGVGSPWLHAQDVRAASAPVDRYDRTLANACEASHRAQAPAPSRGEEGGGRTQSPQWQQQHRAAVEQCLRDGLRVIRTARASN